MAAPSNTESVDALIEAERARSERTAQHLAALANSRLLRPLAWFHRLTGRGPDVEGAKAAAESVGTLPLPMTSDVSTAVVDDFHRLYYNDADRTWRNTRWMGTPIQKLPLDLWLYQEYLHRLKPDLVIETGTLMGGSALYLANILDLIGHGEIISVDITQRPGLPEHPRVTYVEASSIDPDVLADLAARAEGRTVFVILDSDHSAEHVYRELLAYSSIVSVGSYLIVEDTDIHGHPVRPDHPAGPMEAVDRFLAERDDFEVEPDSDRFLLSFHPRGYLRRLR